MTNKQCFFSEDGPCEQRLIDLIFFKWRLRNNDKGTVTFTIKGGDIKIRALVASVGPDKEGRGGWVELTLFDEKATLGNQWLKCVYDTCMRNGLIEVEYANATVEPHATTH